MIRSPGAAASIAPWIVPEAATWKGALPPTVTLTVSTDCLPLPAVTRSEEHTSELQSLTNLVCRLLLEKKNATAIDLHRGQCGGVRIGDEFRHRCIPSGLE